MNLDAGKAKAKVDCDQANVGPDVDHNIILLKKGCYRVRNTPVVTHSPPNRLKESPASHKLR